jgi:hypothetical protein
MVEQDGFELFEVLGQKQALNGAFGQFCESIIGWGKDCEGTFAFEGFDQVSGTQGGSQGGEATIGYSGVNDI